MAAPAVGRGTDLEDLDIPESARWAAVDAGLETMRRRVGEYLARPESFAADLWEVDARWRTDGDAWRDLCAEHGAVLGDRGRFAELGVLAEGAGRAAASIPYIGSALSALVLAAADPSALAELRGGAPGALAWAGPDEPVAVRFVGGLLNGTVAFVFDGAAAEIVVAVAEDDSGATVLCRVDDPSLVGRTTRGIADPTRDLATLTFDAVPASVLCGGTEAIGLLAELETAAAVLLALDAFGSAQAAMDLAVGYAKQRVQFGKVIGSYQAVAHHCANMFLLVENARSLARMAAWSVAWAEPGAALSAAQAKSAATENAVEVGRLAIQVHGGIGMTWARPTHVHYKRAWVDRAALGSARHQRERITTMLTEAQPRGFPPMYRTPF
ncbi:MAG TPA: acyl-CoA dehydrogenase family protein [Pseudonocardia sp.]|nr:acyl-CoA dehydrogenase family protein [Pseudonocardia sp.]